MKKKPTKQKWPNVNVTTQDCFDLNKTEMLWIEAIIDADCRLDLTRLIELLEHDRVPPRVMPYVKRLLLAHVGHKPGRPNLLPTPHAVAYFLAEEQVRELVEEFGWPVFAAAEKVAPQWGLSAKTLASYCSGRSGYSRKHR